MADGKARIAVDAMGGDRAPGAIVEGALQAARELGEDIILVGDSAVVEAECRRLGGVLPVQHASQVVEMCESPSDALRRKRQSSIRVAFEMVKRGEADGVVSAGNSGATLALGMVVLGKLEGVDRPALASLLPSLEGRTLLIDVGANVDCRARNLLQFGLMGSVFVENVLGVASPRVGLLSNGEEASKGNDLVRHAHELLKASSLNFIGNVEGRDLFLGGVDVVVCDGFVGNVCLKLSEGLAEAISKMLRTEFEGSLTAMAGYFLARGAFGRFRKTVDYSEYGGAPLLGINGLGIVCHGKSTPKALKNAIKMAAGYIRGQVNQQLTEGLRLNAQAAAAAVRRQEDQTEIG
ncbi:MAG: phosphate acyltransferase PlsX [Pseudomonadota bacterium]